MYAVDPIGSATQSSAKSCIQALLKTREEHQIRTRSSQRYSQRNIEHFSGGFAIESQVSDTPVIPQSFSEFNPQTVPTEDVEDQNDFNYSQKLFHIDDGNLYSIFSPIQGRSYGMKPSFLRKQKYTVQECHSRGRKNLRKGLKFHNFLPSESVTSEKDNGYLKTKWKVHSECRLREEHGTKQITISNWSQSVQNSSEETSLKNSAIKNNSPSTSTNPESREHRPNNEIRFQERSVASNDPYDFNSSLQNNCFPETIFMQASHKEAEDKAQSSTKTASLRKGSLKSVLNSLLDRPVVHESQICDYSDDNTKSDLSQKHRRKPVQTRRVVPYTKYLSIMEEDESSPLDLSSKWSGKNCHNPSSSEPFVRSGSPNCDMSYPINSQITMNADSLETVSNSRFNPAACNTTSDNIFVNPSSIAHLLQNPITSPLVLLSSPVNNDGHVRPVFPQTSKAPQSTEVVNGKLNANLHTNRVKMNSYPALHTNPGPSFSGNMQYAVHKSFVKNNQPKARRRSQRSVIKKNLEDTFRQNGFLVKTKQVSDGEATFCKFRQLRKYTRYYLKSWQQHLPDEVHKMWKGFLPPKTVLPTVSGVTEATNRMK